MIRRAALLAVAALLAGCESSGSAAAHGGPSARWYFERGDFTWQTAEAPGIHLHYQAGSHAAAHAAEYARAAAAALRHDLALGGLKAPAEPVEIFLVNSLEQAAQLTGIAVEGQAIVREQTSVMVARPGWLPPFRHEIMHVLTSTQWQGYNVRDWLSEGVAMWATGTCQRHSMDALAAGYLRDGTLPGLFDLAVGFERYDMLLAYATSGSVVEFVVRDRGLSGVRTLWTPKPWTDEHPLGPGGEQMEAAWRRHLASIPPARLDTAFVFRHGCEVPDTAAARASG